MTGVAKDPALPLQDDGVQPSAALPDPTPAPGSGERADTRAIGAHAIGGLPFRDVYDREFPVVVRVLRRLGVPERQLEDAAQEVFSVVLRRRADFDPRRPVRPWLCGIATRVASDFRKKVSTVVEIPHDVPPEEGDDRAARQVDARQLLARALDGLSRDERVAILLVDLEGQSAVDIAEALGVPTGTLYARLHSARKKLSAHVARLSEAP